MNPSPINGFTTPADMRDIRAIRDLIKAEASANLLFRAQVRRHLGIAEDEAIAPERPTLTPETWLQRLGRRLDSPPTTRVMVYGYALAVLASILTGCAALPVAQQVWGVHP